MRFWFPKVWVLEMIGKGKFEKGAIWVAVRIPDGHVSGHANQARIQKFPLNDSSVCVYSDDAQPSVVQRSIVPYAR